MNSTKMFLSLIPWIGFTLLVQTLGVLAAGWASLAALLLAAALLLINLRTGVKLIDLTGIATFGVMTALAFAGGHAVAAGVAHFGRGGSALVLAAVMLVSSVTVPFSEQYARESVPRQYWATPAFRSVNRTISATWGAIIAAIAGGHLLYGYLAATSPNGLVPRPGNLILNWAIPIGLIYFGVNRTQTAAAAASQTDSTATS